MEDTITISREEYNKLVNSHLVKPITPTSGMNIAQRIMHVGGRNNAAGYIEFGSIQAVEALIHQVLRDIKL